MQSESRTPTLVFIGDENYGMALAVAMSSLLENVEGAEAINMYILHPDLRDETKSRLRAVAEGSGVEVRLSFIEVDEATYLGHLDLRLEEGWTTTIFYRPLMDRFLPERHSRVLYLDCDIVVEDNVMDLWTADLAGRTILALQERTVSCPRYGVRRWRELGLDPDAPYFNSGVMLIDMNRWREKEVGKRVLDYLHRYGATLNIKGNQEGFNAVLAGDWTPMAQRWNVLNWYYEDELFERFRYGDVPQAKELKRLRAEPGIIHYTHALKPWHPGCSHPARHRFFHYLRRSGWLHPLSYAVWRGAVTARRAGQYLKERSRPLRHRIGLRRTL